MLSSSAYLRFKGKKSRNDTEYVVPCQCVNNKCVAACPRLSMQLICSVLMCCGETRPSFVNYGCWLACMMRRIEVFIRFISSYFIFFSSFRLLLLGVLSSCCCQFSKNKRIVCVGCWSERAKGKAQKRRKSTLDGLRRFRCDGCFGNGLLRHCGSGSGHFFCFTLLDHVHT